ncbi:MAG TPA: EAL domain-containing protein [Porticoccaceae bacterium]|nr:EAL domain-containing protein [Porticoccaceae bacterium]
MQHQSNTEPQSGATGRLLVALCCVLAGGWVPLAFRLTLPQSVAWAAALALLWGLTALALRRRAARRLAAVDQAESTLALIGSHFPLVAWAVDGAGVVRSVYGGGAAGGLRARDLLGWPLDTLTVENPQLAGLVQRARSGHASVGEAVIGGVRYRHHFFPGDREGDFHGFTCISEELSGVRSEAASGQLWRVLFEQSGDAMMVLDNDRKVIAANPGVARITGHATEEIVGRRDRLLVFRPPGAEHQPTLYEQLQRKDVWEGETVVRHKSGQLCEVRVVACVARDEAGQIANYVVMFADLSQTKKAQEELRHLATHDHLTELPNRRLFLDRLDHGIRRARREQRQLVVLFVDIDDFKAINDTYGHHVGDEILREVGRRLREAVRQSDTVARLAGDEFTVLADGPSEEAEALIAKLQACFLEPFVAGERILPVSASVGVALYPSDGADIEGLMQHADRAMYEAKERHKAPAPAAERPQRSYSAGLFFPSELRLAIRRGQLKLVYQPQVELDSGQPVGVEALLRWDHHCRGSINPAEFMELAEEAGITDAIGTWTLSQVAKQLKAWQRWNMPIRQVAINVAISQIQDPGYPGRVVDAIARQGIAPRAIMLEVSEPDYLRNAERCQRFFESARALGLQVCIDQFGAAAQYDYIGELPVDAVKINHKLLCDAAGRADPRLLQMLVALCRVAGKTVMAVGIERSAQEAELLAAGCALGQGFLYSQPLSAEELRTFRPQLRNAGAIRSGCTAV